jgi:hypothetical protein
MARTPGWRVFLTVAICALGGGIAQSATYTGTDEDFLQPTGNPHYASVRRLNQIFREVSMPGDPVWSMSFTRKGVASTHRMRFWPSYSTGRWIV